MILFLLYNMKKVKYLLIHLSFIFSPLVVNLKLIYLIILILLLYYFNLYSVKIIVNEPFIVKVIY